RAVAGASTVCTRGDGRQFPEPRGDLRSIDWKRLGRSAWRDFVGGLLMTTVGQENARMLASLLGIEVADAAERLDQAVQITAALAACHIAAAALHRVIGSSSLPRLGLPLSVDFAELGIPERGLATPLDISGAALIGGGAVGNGFLRALRHLRVRGTLPIVDPK